MTTNTSNLESLVLKSKCSWRYKRSRFTDTLLILDSVVTGQFGIKQKELHLKAPSPPSTGNNSAVFVLIFLHKWLTTASRWFCLSSMTSLFGTHQVIDLIGQLDLLICILQSFVIILKQRSVWSHKHLMKSSSVLILSLIICWPTSDTHLFNDLHLFFSPLRFVLLCIDKELNHLLLQLVGGVWTTADNQDKQPRHLHTCMIHTAQ